MITGLALCQAWLKYRQYEMGSSFVRLSYLCFVPKLAETASEEKKLDEISRWLSPVSCVEKHYDTHKLRQGDTCTWFPNTDAYKEWRFGVHRLLWLHGKGGVVNTSHVTVSDAPRPFPCLL